MEEITAYVCAAIVALGIVAAVWDWNKSEAEHLTKRIETCVNAGGKWSNNGCT